jgi:hypothetical protein
MEFLNIKSPNFFGGQNVINVALIAGLAFVAWKLK